MYYSSPHITTTYIDLNKNVKQNQINNSNYDTLNHKIQLLEKKIQLLEKKQLKNTSIYIENRYDDSSLISYINNKINIIDKTDRITAIIKYKTGINETIYDITEFNDYFDFIDKQVQPYKIKEIWFSNKIEYIGKKFFNGIKGNKVDYLITFPQSLKYIYNTPNGLNHEDEPQNNKTYPKCNTDLILPNIKCLGDNTFAWNCVFNNVEISNVEYIGKNVFRQANIISIDCIELKNIKYIGNGAFCNSNIKKFKFFNEVPPEIHKYTFLDETTSAYNVDIIIFCPVQYFENYKNVFKNKFTIKTY